MIEFSSQTLTRDDYHQKNHFHHPIDINIPSIDWKGNLSNSNQISFPYTNDKILITGAYEEVLKVKTNQIIQILENTIHSKILKISLIYYFNTSLTPFIVSCKKITIEPKENHKSKLYFNPSPTNNNNNNNNNNNTEEDLELVKHRELDDQNEILNKLQSDLLGGGVVKFSHINKYNRVESKGEIEVLGVLPSDYTNSPPKKTTQNSQSPTKHHPFIQRTTTEIYGTTEDRQIKKDIIEEVLKNSKEQDQASEEGFNQIYQSTTPNKTEIRSKYGGKRLTVLDNFISLNPHHSSSKKDSKSPTNNQNIIPNNSFNSNNNNMTSTILESYKIGIENTKLPGDSIKTKRYAQLTDAQSYRIKSYSDKIKGSSENEHSSNNLLQRRPISAPHPSKKLLNTLVFDFYLSFFFFFLG